MIVGAIGALSLKSAPNSTIGVTQTTISSGVAGAMLVAAVHRATPVACCAARGVRVGRAGLSVPVGLLPLGLLVP